MGHTQLSCVLGMQGSTPDSLEEELWVVLQENITKNNPKHAVDIRFISNKYS
ncbi:MAG: hypothetical protein ABF264_08670 [Flavobacteriales bacterium]